MIKIKEFKVNLIFRFGIIPTVNKPTRVTRYTATAIDHVFTNATLDNIQIVKTDISDHFPNIFATKNKIDAKMPEQTFVLTFNCLNFSDQSIDKFSKNLAISIGIISKFYKVSIIRRVNLSKFFFPCTTSAF